MQISAAGNTGVLAHLVLIAKSYAISHRATGDAKRRGCIRVQAIHLSYLAWFHGGGPRQQVARKDEAVNNCPE
jgi:hypothetical protein